MGLLRQGKLENTLLVQFALRPQTMPRSNKKGGRHICGKPGIWRQFQRVNGVGGALLTIWYLLVMNWDRRVKLLNLHLARNYFKFFFSIVLSWVCEIDMCFFLSEENSRNRYFPVLSSSDMRETFPKTLLLSFLSARSPLPQEVVTMPKYISY